MQKYTVKFIFWKQKINPAGQSPIYLKITVNRKTAYISTGHFITEKAWNEKSETVRDLFPLAKKINADLQHRKNLVMQKIVELQVANKDFSAKIIKDQFSRPDQANIFNFIEDYCKEVKHKKGESTIVVYNREKNTLKNYHGSNSLTFEDITTDYLRDFEKFLRDKEYGNNYIFGIFKTLRVFFNAARKRSITTHYPFAQYENPVYKQPKKNRLTLEELARWEAFVDTCTNKVWKEAGIYFLLGCYTGLRVSDWKAFDIAQHLQGNMILIAPTKKSTGFVSVPVSPPLQRTLERMRLAPLTIEDPTINEKLKEIAKKAGINKRVTTHTGRHTFAITICAEGGVSCEVCAKLMGITVATCEKNYYRVTQKKIHDETIIAWQKLL